LDQQFLGAADFPPASAMLRTICFAALAAAMPLQGAPAEELAKANLTQAIAKPASSTSAGENNSSRDLYLLCAFYPKPGTCERIYGQAMKDTSIWADAVRAEYTGYVRYLGGTANLTDADRQYLKENSIMIPNDLSAANQAGLHNVINDVTLVADAKRAAVNNFVSRAVEAELYCGFNSCGDTGGEMATAGG
jgi:hypothetical protein